MSGLPATIHDLETPALLVERGRLEANLGEMAALCRKADVRLRPHVKTHKCVELARLQQAGGASGLTAAKVSEAAVFAEAGFSDILVAYPLVGRKPGALRRIAEDTGARLSTVADSPEGVEGLSSAWVGASEPLPVHLKVDTGFGRVGVPVDDPDRAADLAGLIERAPGLLFAGILTHAGHAYAAVSAEEVESIGREEGESMAVLAGRLRRAGIEVGEVSVGSTPTARRAAQVPGVTEVRPGNYVFHDAIQVSLGVVPLERCALTVWTTVVSRAAPDRAVCDAGSKVFSSDRRIRGEGSGEHGIVLDGEGRGDPGLRLARLSEEHGWLSLDPGHGLEVGRRLRVVPAHACPTVNLSPWLWVVEGERVLERWPVAARGRVT